MKNIYFNYDNCQFKAGKNVTVRMGDRWHKLLSPGEMLNIIDYETESISRTAEVIHTDYVPFESISEDVLIYETSGVKTKDQLLTKMESTYKDFDSKGFVSVVTFSV